MSRARRRMRRHAGPATGSTGSGATRSGARGEEPGRSGAEVLHPEIAFEDRMGTVEFRVAPTPHIVVDSDVCRSCTTTACVTACPADLFVPTSDGGVLFNYEQCFECGTCSMVCNEEGAISWSYPPGGSGVVFRSS